MRDLEELKLEYEQERLKCPAIFLSKLPIKFINNYLKNMIFNKYYTSKKIKDSIVTLQDFLDYLLEK